MSLCTGICRNICSSLRNNSEGNDSKTMQCFIYSRTQYKVTFTRESFNKIIIFYFKIICKLFKVFLKIKINH